MKNSAQRKFSSTRDEREIVSLRDLSARVGSDPLLVHPPWRLRTSTRSSEYTTKAISGRIGFGGRWWRCW